MPDHKAFELSGDQKTQIVVALSRRFDGLPSLSVSLRMRLARRLRNQFDAARITPGLTTYPGFQIREFFKKQGSLQNRLEYRTSVTQRAQVHGFDARTAHRRTGTRTA